MKYKKIILCFSISLIIIGCTNDKQNNKSAIKKPTSEQNKLANDSNVVKIYVKQNGVITANEHILSLQELDSSLKRLKQKNGMVYYSRVNAQADPPPESMKVMEIVICYNLPIRLYTDETFTVIVEPN